MRPPSRFLLAPAVLALAVAVSARAQEDKFSATPVIEFVPAEKGKVYPAEMTQEELKKLAFTEDPQIRPNTATEYLLYVRNPTQAPKTYVVDVQGGAGSGLSAQVEVTIPADRWVRVRLPKPPPPPPPAVPPAPAPAPA